jgi:hypothetical protein
VKQGLIHELVNTKLVVLGDVGGATDASLEACISLIGVKVDASGDAMGLRCHAFDLHPKQ